MTRTTRALGVAAAVLAVCALIALGAHRRGSEAPRAARFVGSGQCAPCHQNEYNEWKASQHAVAMQEARVGTVLGAFDSTRFVDAGVTTIFYRRGAEYFVNSEGPDGKNHDYAIRYTFGVWPLQQYLAEFPGGRYQALPIAWDARPQAQGGQRWFSLTAGERISHTDELHWTGAQYNWNYMCADCHSTAVRKQYDAERNQFNTTHAEISVGCEACHGPGSLHAQWGKYPRFIRAIIWENDRIPAQLSERVGVRWAIDSSTGNARRSAPRTSDREIETCAQCHARRVHIADGYTAGEPFTDFYDPLLLPRDVYFPDGQQRDEVYTYGSFLQSRMYSFGVTCSDCHNPHTGKTRLPGNAVCGQCHRGAKYDTSAHTFHARGSRGSLCVSCHMPDTTYMQIDPRHDHSIRIPRPDRSVTLGVPNACNRCHSDRGARWAADLVRSWYGHTPGGFQRFAEAFAADEREDSTAADSLAAVANDASEPAIVRASALARLGEHPGTLAFDAARFWSNDKRTIVRRATLQILEAAPPNARSLAVPLLRDPRRAVRQEAAWVLAPVGDSLPGSEDRRAFRAAAEEFVASQRYNADRADARIALGTFFAQRGSLDSAIAEYRAAGRLAPRNVQAHAYLAEILRRQGQVDEAIAELEVAISLAPNEPELAKVLASLRAQRRR